MRRLAGTLPLVVALALLAGCGAGGFGNKNPTELTNTITSYVALGDSFAAGPYLGRTTDASCLRSADNYPAQVAKALKITKVTDVSCAGASSKSITSKTKAAATKKQLAAQIRAITKDTELITLGIGLEDDRLITKMFTICAELPCGTAVSPKPVISQLKKFGDLVTAAVRAIQEKAPQAYIVLVGYPNFTPTSVGCSKIPKTSAAQLDAATKVVDTINASIRSAAQQTGAAYIDVSGLATNHELCSDDPWVGGKDAKKGRSVAYQPLAAEQKAVAEAVAAQVQSR